MSSSGLDRRLKSFLILVSALMLTLIGRLWMLQISNLASASGGGETPMWMRFTADALQNRTKVVRTAAPRGMIYDRNGAVLVENRPKWNLVITPADLPDDPAERPPIPLVLPLKLLPRRPPHRNQQCSHEKRRHNRRRRP